MRVGSVSFRRRSDKLWLLGALLVLGLSMLNYWREAISEKLLPDPRLNRKLELAEKALKRGELSRGDGAGARELYESVLATDPDQTLAREGLAKVRNAALARADAALRAHRLEEARANLGLASSLSAPLPQLQPLRARLRELDEASVDVPALLARAAAPGAPEEDVLRLLNQVLALDAGNTAALEGRSELFSDWLLRAERALDAGRVADADAIVARVMAEDAAHVDLPTVRARLGEVQAQRQRGDLQRLERARANERAGRDAAAAESFLALAGANPEAREALARLAERAARQAERDAADFHFERAERGLARARRWHAASPAIAPAQARLLQARAARQRFPLESASKDRERLPVLLEEARQALERGALVTPPGTSAWDKLRVAAAIAPASPSVRALQREFARRGAECFREAMAAGQPNRAQTCLEAWLAQEPTATEGAAARLAMAERWLAYADERIGASDWPAAEQALESARRWQPRHPRLREAQQRLRRARGGAR